jgi:SsrA-binding protein
VAEKSGIKIVAKNPKAYHEYYIVEKFEAGIELFGTEVKSIRSGNISLKEAWCSIQDGELYLKQMHISPYERGSFSNRDPLRPKRLLMHKKEIMLLLGKIQQQGYTLVPLTVYFRNSRVKVEIALAKGKKLHDKRASAAEKDAKRQMDRAMKERNQY